MIDLNNELIKLLWSGSHAYIDGLEQDRSNSIANALELLQSCTKPSIWISAVLTHLIEAGFLVGCGSSQKPGACRPQAPSAAQLEAVVGVVLPHTAALASGTAAGIGCKDEAALVTHSGLVTSISYQDIGLSQFQVMACRLFSTKSFP